MYAIALIMKEHHEGGNTYEYCSLIGPFNSEVEAGDYINSRKIDCQEDYQSHEILALNPPE